MSGSSTVRCLLMGSDGQRTFTPCTLQARAEYHADAKSVFSIFSLLPHSPLPPERDAAAAEGSAETSGFERMSAMLAAAEEPETFMIDIESLGLELAQADFDELAASTVRSVAMHDVL